MSHHFRPTRATIDISALRHNLQQVRRLAPKSRVMAVIKANGYGHGLLTVAKALHQADGFAVASLDEALQLRQAGFLHPILLLEGVYSEAEWCWVFQHRIDTVIHHFQQLETLDQAWRNRNHLNKPQNPNPKVAAKNAKNPSPAANGYGYPTLWIKCDTGMHRLGFAADEVPALNQRLQQWSGLNTVWMSHFATADEDLSFARQQLDCFLQLVPQQAAKSMANSAAIQNLPESHFHWVRPGIMLYGAADNRLINTTDISHFKPAMTFETQVIALKPLHPGECVGYGCDFTASKTMLLAVLAVGYGDGYPRTVANHPDASVSYHHQRLPIVGRISMDMMTVDASSVAKQIHVGDWVELWGKHLPVQEVAKWAQTISYELVTGLTQRVPRISR
ncbi:alanine racemase [Galenea microaerophila]